MTLFARKRGPFDAVQWFKEGEDSPALLRVIEAKAMSEHYEVMQ